ncbi:MAG: response regulator [Phycisphaerae bacterium]|nr:response regulator [Phycisphaerae bacterium]
MRCILHVEDNEDQANLIRMILEEGPVPVRVHRVPCGFSAVQFLDTCGGPGSPDWPDLILLDLNMPKVNGHEMLAAIKADRTLRAIPVIVLTSSDEPSDRQLAYSHHASSYLVKPTDPDQLRQMIWDMQTFWGRWNRGPVGTARAVGA